MLTPTRAALLSAALALFGLQAHAAAPDPTEPAFRSLYKELIETNTSFSVGSCTLAAERMGRRLTEAGFTEADLHVFAPPGHPREGGLVAEIKGSDPKAKAILLLAHIDVVEAKREDWVRDPFTLIEEGGYFYARGASDDKAMAAVFTDMLVRFKKEGFTPRRAIRLALTCGEETEAAFNGAAWLVSTHKDWIDAAFALNEGAGGLLDEKGNKVSLGVQAGEKVYQDFRIEATNPGGHSSQPVPDNAIYHIAGALTRLAAYDFPVRANDATRGYFSRTAPLIGGEAGAAMTAFAKDPTDAAAAAVLSRDRAWHSMLRTTCVATLLDGGHAVNALPQRAGANINCRIFPGEPVSEVQAKLAELVNDPQVSLKAEGALSPTPPAPPLTPQIMGPIEKVSHQMWPGVPVIPAMLTGATDGRYLNAGGIPTYGLSGMFADRSGSGVHGLNERILVSSLMEGRQFLTSVVRLYADQK